jgi:hypothetical protein
MVCRLLLGFFQTVVRHSFRGKDKEIGKKRWKDTDIGQAKFVSQTKCLVRKLSGKYKWHAY